MSVTENDNLPLADGHENQHEAVQSQENHDSVAEESTPVAAEIHEEPIAAPAAAVEQEAVAEAIEPDAIIETAAAPEAVEPEAVAEAIEPEAVVETAAAPEAVAEDIEPEAVVETVAAPVAMETEAVEPAAVAAETNTDAGTSETEEAMEAIQEANAEAGETESASNNEAVPMKEYADMSMEALVEELQTLVHDHAVMRIRTHAEEIRKAFMTQFHALIDEKRKAFYAENPETTDDFQYHLPIKGTFDQLYSTYRDAKTSHLKSIESALKNNLTERMAIVDSLKALVTSSEPMPVILKQFNGLRDRWKVAGPIPKDKYNHVWNNYHFHVENFYDVLHLDREARDLDFKHNLVQKLKIIERAEELAKQADIHDAFRELQNLHRVWKEEIGPVSQDKREEIWVRFSDITRHLHDRREAHYATLREGELANLKAKKEIIEHIEQLSASTQLSHNDWQKLGQEVEQLRKTYFTIGRVPNELNEETWAAYKHAVRNFNNQKNNFYKDLKKEQNQNLNRKKEIIAQAESLKDSEDFATTSNLLKALQEEWKHIGHVPRKLSDELWKEFRAACNHFFDRMKEVRNAASEEEQQAFDKKREYLEQLNTLELSGDHKTDLEAIKAHIEMWKSFGRVPVSKRHVEGKFNKILDKLFGQLSSSKKDNEMARFTSRVEMLAGADDSRKLDNEMVFIQRKIEEIKHEIFQLENNIQFFNSSNDDNPLVKEVRKNIEKHREEWQLWKDKLAQLRTIKKA
ncbi:MAG: chromosome segregation protein [Flavobacterium sp. BFFFF2]|nr:MAG: chromosome segregation protein [Flavobacterium sp. BFFFF2]